MFDYKEELKKLKPFFGKEKKLKDGSLLYFLRPSDRGSESDLMDELLESFEGSKDENGEKINFKDYVVIACDGVYLEESEIEVEQLSDILIMNKKSGIILYISEGTYQSGYSSIETLIDSIDK